MSELIEAVKANDVEKVRNILLFDFNKYCAIDALSEIKIIFQMQNLDLDIKDISIMFLRKMIKKDISLIPTIIDLIEPIILTKIGTIYDIDHCTIYEILDLFDDVIALYADDLKDKNNPIYIKLFKLLTPLTFRRDNRIDYLANLLRNKIR